MREREKNRGAIGRELAKNNLSRIKAATAQKSESPHTLAVRPIFQFSFDAVVEQCWLCCTCFLIGLHPSQGEMSNTSLCLTKLII